MKKIITSLAILLFTFSILIPTSASAAGYTNANAFFLDGLRASVIKDCYVFESDSVSTYGYSTYVYDVQYMWSKTPNSDITFWKSGSATHADVRVYAGDFGLDLAGIAQPYINGKPVTEEKAQRWDYVNVNINDEYMKRNKISERMKKKTVVHEFGHVLSLKHQPSNSVSVMKQGTTTYTLPQPLDKNNISWKY